MADRQKMNSCWQRLSLLLRLLPVQFSAMAQKASSRALNREWGTVFWSNVYTNSQVPVPCSRSPAESELRP